MIVIMMTICLWILTILLQLKLIMPRVQTVILEIIEINISALYILDMYIHIQMILKYNYFVWFCAWPVTIQPMAYTQMVTPMIDKAVAPLYMLVSCSVRLRWVGVPISVWNIITIKWCNMLHAFHTFKNCVTLFGLCKNNCSMFPGPWLDRIGLEGAPLLWPNF